MTDSPTFTERNQNFDDQLKTWCPVDHNYNFLYRRHSFAYLGVAKCGSVTMRKSLGEVPAYDRAAAMEMETRLAVIRHPFDRLVSAWRYAWSKVPFMRFWQHVEANPFFDFHTMPYSKLLGTDPTEIVTLEQIRVWWPGFHTRFPGLFPPTPLWMNATTERPSQLPQGALSVRSAVEQCYAEDLALWHASLK